MTKSDGPAYARAARVDFDAIPVVDLAEIGTEAGFQAIGDAVVRAAQDIGFFYVSNHGISEDLIDTAFHASKAFFALDEAQKASVAVDQNQRGWMAQGQSNLEGSKTHDAKEVFFWGWDIAPDDPDLGLPLVALNQWPDRVAPAFKLDILPYYTQVVALSRSVLAALAVGLGLERDFFAAAYARPLARGQLVYYPSATDRDLSEERFGAAAHSDFGVLTMLMQDNSGGLQVRNLAGDWIEAPPIAGTFVCNIGDLLERWSGGRLVSTKHRVLNRSGHARYSIPIFCDPNSAALVDPKDMGGDGFEPISAGAYIVGKNKKNFSHYKK
jgi:isopenicillin N synthase-like dioxygenase